MILRVKAFEDWWTYYISQLDSRTVVCATNRRYFEEALDRKAHPQRDRALPPQLPEWGFVNTQAAFWGLRHYDHLDAAGNPTSPLAGGRREVNTIDDGAVGWSFSYVPGQKMIKIMYMSKTRNAARIAREMFDLDGPAFQVQVNGLNVVRLLARLSPPGLVRDDDWSRTVLLIMQALGHAMYL